jgi:tRNA-Thr(GGU) m(6)t(6)A37 methyltransferase TsaA
MTHMSQTSPLPAIGIVRTRYRKTEDTPIHASLNRGEQATIEIADLYTEGLDGLAGFDFAWLITWLHRPHDGSIGSPPLRQVPFLLRAQQRKVGLFATRSPRRVNPIGLSLIQIVEVAGPVIHFAGVDLLDGTPVLDIKPYVSRFDRPPGEPSCGWFDGVAIADGTIPGHLGVCSPPDATQTP